MVSASETIKRFSQPYGGRTTSVNCGHTLLTQPQQVSQYYFYTWLEFFIIFPINMIKTDFTGEKV